VAGGTDETELAVPPRPWLMASDDNDIVPRPGSCRASRTDIALVKFVPPTELSPSISGLARGCLITGVGGAGAVRFGSDFGLGKLVVAWTKLNGSLTASARNIKNTRHYNQQQVCKPNTSPQQIKWTVVTYEPIAQTLHIHLPMHGNSQNATMKQGQQLMS